MAAKCIQVLFPARPSTCQSGRNPGSIVRDLQQVLALGSGGPHRMQSLAERQSQLAPELRPVRPATRGNPERATTLVHARHGRDNLPGPVDNDLGNGPLPERLPGGQLASRGWLGSGPL